MEYVIVERVFEGEPLDLDDLEALQEKGSWCYQLHGVRFLQSFYSADGRRMICLYEAPDAEAVRTVNRQSGVPFERAWTAAVYDREAVPGVRLDIDATTRR